MGSSRPWVAGVVVAVGGKQQRLSRRWVAGAVRGDGRQVCGCQGSSRRWVAVVLGAGAVSGRGRRGGGWQGRKSGFGRDGRARRRVDSAATQPQGREWQAGRRRSASSLGCGRCQVGDGRRGGWRATGMDPRGVRVSWRRLGGAVFPILSIRRRIRGEWWAVGGGVGGERRNGDGLGEERRYGERGAAWRSWRRRPSGQCRWSADCGGSNRWRSSRSEVMLGLF